MATSSGGVTPELSETDLGKLYETLHPVRAKYKLIGLKFGVAFNEIKNIETNYKESWERLLEILSYRLKQKPALTCAEVNKALRSESVNEPQTADAFLQSFITEKKMELSDASKEEKSKESDNHFEKSEKGSKIKKHNIECENKSLGDKEACISGHRLEKSTRRDFSSEQSKADECKEDERMPMKSKPKGKEVTKLSVPSHVMTDHGQSKIKPKKESAKRMTRESEVKASLDQRKECSLLKSDTMTERARKTESATFSGNRKHQLRSTGHTRVKTAYKQECKIPGKEEPAKKQATAREEIDTKNILLKCKSDDNERETVRQKAKLGVVTHAAQMQDKTINARKIIPQKVNAAAATGPTHHKAPEQVYRNKSGEESEKVKDKKRGLEVRTIACGESHFNIHSQKKHRKIPIKTEIRDREAFTAKSSEKVSDEGQNDSENENHSFVKDHSFVKGYSEGNTSDEEDKPGTEKEVIIPNEDDKEKCLSKQRQLSEAFLSVPDSPGDYQQSDSGCGRQGQQDHDIQRSSRKKKKKHKRESSASPATIRSSSPSSSQDEQPFSKKQKRTKKHKIKGKEKHRGLKNTRKGVSSSSGAEESSPECKQTKRKKKGKEKRGGKKKERKNVSNSSGIDDSSPECDKGNNHSEGEKKNVLNIFEQFYGQVCCLVFDPVTTAVELQKKNLISIELMKNMILSPKSRQEKIIHLVDGLHKKIKSHPDCFFVCIEVMLEIGALKETASEILREAGAVLLRSFVLLCFRQQHFSVQVECFLMKQLQNFQF